MIMAYVTDMSSSAAVKRPTEIMTTSWVVTRVSNSCPSASRVLAGSDPVDITIGRDVGTEVIGALLGLVVGIADGAIEGLELVRTVAVANMVGGAVGCAVGGALGGKVGALVGEGSMMQLLGTVMLDCVA